MTLSIFYSIIYPVKAIIWQIVCLLNIWLIIMSEMIFRQMTELKEYLGRTVLGIPFDFKHDIRKLRACTMDPAIQQKKIIIWWWNQYKYGCKTFFKRIIRLGQRAHGGCDSTANDAYSLLSPDPHSNFCRFL